MLLVCRIKIYPRSMTLYEQAHLLELDFPKTPLPSSKTASHVCHVYGMSSTGNNVFRAQIEANGAKITKRMINPSNPSSVESMRSPNAAGSIKTTEDLWD